MNRLVVAGLAAFCLGAAALVAPGLVPVGVDRLAIPFAGIGALVLAFLAVRARRRAGLRRTLTGDPEVAGASPVPGDDLFSTLRSFPGSRGAFTREGLRDAATGVLVRYEGLAGEEASDRVAAGTWTDDRLAAAHLVADPSVPVLARLLDRLPGESRYRAGRRRAIQAIARRAGLEVDTAPWRPRLLPERLPFADRVEPVAATPEPATVDTGTWRGVSAVALAAVGVGALAEAPALVLAGVVAVGAVVYARTATPAAAPVEVERSVETNRPDPGDSVEVTLTVRNAGSSGLPDLRVVDGVPEALSVVSGSPRLATSLPAGGEVDLAYAVAARRGVHGFDPTTVVARDRAGVAEVARTESVETTLTCVPTPRPVEEPIPLRPAATPHTGPNRTPEGGEGVEFFASRPYQPGDPTSRIDWRRRARTGELVTIDYRQERAATVVVVIDAREPCFCAPEPHAPHAVDRAVEGAGRVVETLLADGDRVGVATFGTDCWLAPAGGRDQRVRARELLATDPGLSPAGPAAANAPGHRWLPRLERRLPPDAQVVVFTPLLDADSGRLVRRLDARGVPGTVVSPDPTGAATPGQLLARTARRVRVTDLRRAGVPVLDWGPTEPIEAPFARHRWGR